MNLPLVAYADCSCPSRLTKLQLSVVGDGCRDFPTLIEQVARPLMGLSGWFCALATVSLRTGSLDVVGTT
ncbi:MAG: hypothetical protein AB8B91_03590 [Rubripirellula sp.]